MNKFTRNEYLLLLRNISILVACLALLNLAPPAREANTLFILTLALRLLLLDSINHWNNVFQLNGQTIGCSFLKLTD